ncbi:unnamed protein product [Angiostrongylus costaricensis]|uniref:Uncharacterized protein n=1 Tax=Angiostrongylus costaricensis TaxID=334426 RepID=A0A158PI04_ANGCS|nr:unnamed protein product [Angiostrongylus costaricensis]
MFRNSVESMTAKDKRCYGLVSEQCPSATVGCRIKVRADHIEWYEWSKLYDRNQLVCIYPGEYRDTAERTTTTTTTTTITTTSTTAPPLTTKVTYGRSHMLDRATTFAPESTTMLSTTTVETIENDLEPKEFFSSTAVSQFGKEFEETRRKLLEEMREEDERLQQLLADEEAEMLSDDVDSAEEREEQRRKERERNRMERRERARADERRRLTEEEELRKHEKSQKHKEVLHSDENSDRNDESKQSIASLWTSVISSIITISFVMFRL